MDSKTDILIIGCGLSGAAAARQLADRGRRVLIWERRDHIGGNLYDYQDSHGFWVHRYGPHTFHTHKKALYDYICRFGEWDRYELRCGAYINGKFTPAPFNFTTIDTFYPPEKAQVLKNRILAAFPGQATAPVTQVLQHPDPMIQGYAQFLFDSDYRPYTAKQWGVPPEEIDPSVLERVPLRFDYNNRYFDDPYQVVPRRSYTDFFERLLDHPNIQVKLGVEALEHLSFQPGENRLHLDGASSPFPILYTGALDELFGGCFGPLPYRSLRFEWRYSEEDSFQEAAVTAYPQALGFTRITEYKKLPIQPLPGTSYAVEYPLPYIEGKRMEPYYPLLTRESQERAKRYRTLADSLEGFYYCGRLADFRYYNMDGALDRCLTLCKSLLG